MSEKEKLCRLTCPHCNFSGPMKKGKVSFWTFTIFEHTTKAREAKRTAECPKCRTRIIFPRKVEFETC